MTEEIEEIVNVTLEEFPELQEPSNLNARIEEILMFSTCLLSAALTIFVIYLIFRFKELRTKTNICFANWLITTMLLLVSNPAIYEFFVKLFGLPFSILNIILIDFFITMVDGNVMFMTILSFNFLFVKNNLRFKVALVVGWVSLVSYFIINMFDFFFYLYTDFVLLCKLIIFGLAILFNLGCYVKHLISKTSSDDEKIRLNLVAFYLGTIILIILFTVIANVVHMGGVMNMLLLRLVLVIIITFPISIIILLIQLDKNFKLCFLQLGKHPHSYIESRIYYGNISNSQTNLQLSF